MATIIAYNYANGSVFCDKIKKSFVRAENWLLLIVKVQYYAIMYATFPFLYGHL